MKVEIEIAAWLENDIVLESLGDHLQALEGCLKDLPNVVPVHTHDVEGERKALKKDIKALRRVLRMYGGDV